MLTQADEWTLFLIGLPQEDQDRIRDTTLECVKQIRIAFDSGELGMSWEELQKYLTEDVPPFEVYG